MRILVSIALATTLLYPVSSLSQNCNSINDEAGIITNPTLLQHEIDNDSRFGLEANIITVGDMTKYGAFDLAKVLDSYLSHCPGWLVHGKLASNRIILMVHPDTVKEHRMMTSYYNKKSFQSTSESAMQQIMVTYAGPFFRNQNYSEGFVSALGAYRAIYLASLSLKSPSASTTASTSPDKEDTSFVHSGLAIFLLFIFLVALVGVIILYRYEKHLRKSSIITAQQDAASAMQAADKLYKNLDEKSSSYKYLTDRYLSLSNSTSLNPDSEGLTEAQYRRSEIAWKGLAQELKGSSYSSAYSDKTHTDSIKNITSSFPRSSYPPTNVSYPSSTNTVVIDRGGSNLGSFAAGMMVEDALDSNSNRPEPTRYEESTPSYGSQNDDDGVSGGDTSSFDSSDTDSNYSSDSSSDSGSFDTGGGDTSSF